MTMEKHGDISPESTPAEHPPHIKAMLAQEDQKFLDAVNKQCCGGGECGGITKADTTEALEKLADDTSQRLADQAAGQCSNDEDCQDDSKQ